MNKKFYTIKEVAEILGVSRQTVFNWVKWGKIKAIQKVPDGGAIRIPASEIFEEQKNDAI